VIRTQVVPTAARANGSASSAERDNSRAGPRRGGVPFQASDRFRSRPVPDPLAEQPEGRNTSTAISTMNANTSW